MAFVSGKIGKATVGGSDICITGWELTWNTEALDVTCTGSLGAKDYIKGLQSSEVKIDANIDVNADPFATNKMNPDNDLFTNVVLYAGDPVNNHTFTINNMVVQSFTVTSAVDGVVSFSASLIGGAVTESI